MMRLVVLNQREEMRGGSDEIYLEQKSFVRFELNNNNFYEFFNIL